MEKVLVAMSGGVDSSVTAYLLKNEGYSCDGCTMVLREENNDLKDAENDDLKDAENIATKLGMNFNVFTCRDEFKKYVIAPFVESYLNGETPNPCIECNKYLKFGKFLEDALNLGYDKIATGHYARIEFENEKYKLKKALDPSKDQSYVLYNLTQDVLSRVLFPLGDMTKAQAREIAEKEGFINAKKGDSQDICFVPDGDYASVIESFISQENIANSSFSKALNPGDFIHIDGNVLGTHKGIIHYTIGQRKGLGISFNEPLYVVKINPTDSSVILGKNEDLFSANVNIKNFHWIDGEDEIPVDFSCNAKIRYKHKEQPCTVHYNGDGTAVITFEEPQRAATPGQSAVLYDNDTVLGGGIIY